ncbi:hypothetical protein [Protaetiibacter mangrovi]|uniref:Uncharacterized protein n=1 Tax=Protaetiibacter mangrovi TaxID=2970926 RepID=A0ABT1ZDE8_9MICO|nr:hypothetical protein [Protaetiibacter mangrovi]MCS0498713.1 hypothetical protein [Protaetiibacter mangrovi]TPX03739.1 hypothetical protein FJ656_15570 [Schumannella luteola]
MSPSPPRTPWREPTSLLPLRWGDHATRLWAGSWLVVGGGVSIAGSNTEALWVLAMGTAAHVVGWCILPSAGWRRVVAVAPATLTMWLLLAGPRFLVVLALPYLLWLLVRHRPRLASLTGIGVAAVALLVGDAVGQDYSRMLPALAVVGATMVGGAWVARLIARRTIRAD